MNMKRIISLIVTLCFGILFGVYIASASSIDWRQEFINKYEQDIKEPFGDKVSVVAPSDMTDTVCMVYSDDSLTSVLVSYLSGDTGVITAFDDLRDAINAYSAMYYIFVKTYDTNGHFSIYVLNPLDTNKILLNSVDGVMVYDALKESTSEPSSPTQDQAQQETTESATATTESYDLDLTAGHYIGGLGIPTGRYTLTWVANSGNVHSPMKVNEIFREDKTTVYNNFDFNTGTELEVSGGLVLHIHTDNARFDGIKQREIEKEVETILAPGNYIAGTDFPEGTYFITAYEGHGNIHSYEAGVNEIISTEPDGRSIYQYNYATFAVGDPLEVSSCTVKLVPAGD